MPRDFLIDTDTASDDAVALIMALRAPDVYVRAITIVAGNVPLEVECASRAMEACRIQTGEAGISLPDPVAMCIALDPAVCTVASRHHVDVEVSSDLTRGMTVVDRLGAAIDERNRAVWRSVLDHTPPAQAVWSIDTDHWKQQFYSALRRRESL